MFGTGMTILDQQFATARNAAQQAAALEACGNLPAAIQMLDQAAWCMMNAANGAVQAGIFLPANVHFDFCLILVRAAQSRAQIGMIPAAQQNLFQALAAINQAIALSPQVPHYYSTAGAILCFQGNYPEAIRAFRLALSLNPGDAYARNMLAQLGQGAAPQYAPAPAYGAMAPTGQTPPANAGAGQRPMDMVKAITDVANMIRSVGQAYNAFSE